jgi:uncharacterized protein YkwD
MIKSFKERLRERLDRAKPRESGSQTPKQSQQPRPGNAQPQTQQPQQTQNSSALNDLERGLLSHNNARSSKGVSTLQWDDQLAKQAQTYAQELANKNTMQHSGVNGQGENLYMSTGDASFEDAVKSWLDEEKAYKGEKIGEGNLAAWGHYSAYSPFPNQLLWA